MLFSNVFAHKPSKRQGSDMILIIACLLPLPTLLFPICFNEVSFMYILYLLNTWLNYRKHPIRVLVISLETNK